MSEGQERLESIEQAAERLSVSTVTVRRLIKNGDIRAVRVSKRVLIPTSELERVVAQGCGKHAGRRPGRL